MKWLFGIFAVIFVFFAIFPGVYAATISGTVYDFSLHPVKAVISIDSTPKQTVVAANGTYDIELPAGNYTLTAEVLEKGGLKEVGNENVVVAFDGDFKVDIIVLPNFDEEPIDEVEPVEVIDQNGNYMYRLIFLALVIIIISIICFKELRTKKGNKSQISECITPQHDEINKILEFISSRSGRTTQKEIRDKFPSSEAKISLILTQLEAEGKIRKIKQGRGNVILGNTNSINV